MKKTVCLALVLAGLLLWAGCALQSGAPVASSPPMATAPSGQLPPQPSASESDPAAEEANAWVVTSDAPVINTATGKQEGTAYPGFGVSISQVSDGKGTFRMTSMDDKGENVKETKTFAIDTNTWRRSMWSRRR